MSIPKVFRNVTALAKHLAKLHDKRRERRLNGIRIPRLRLSVTNRGKLLAKTGSRCHICGGRIKYGESWAADHVLAHARGGSSSADNYLPAHALCNNYRWYYESEELQWILKLGVWFRSSIEKGDSDALALADRFVQYELRRDKRRIPR